MNGSQMTTSTQQHTPAVLEVDLWPYVRALVNWWKLIIAGAVLFAAVAAYLASTKPYMYESTARVSILELGDPGGVSPDDRRAPEMLTLVEHGFVMGTTRDNHEDVILARMRSRQFTMRFLDNHDAYPHFYPDMWDASEQRWADGFKPDRGEVFTRFRDEVRSINRDEETGIVTVSMTWPDAAVARDWANAYVTSFNSYMRERTMQEVSRKQAYLEQELRRSDVLEIQQSIYRLIEAQTAIAMLASGREEFVLEIIDPAALPYRSFNMSRKKRVVISGIAGLLLGTFSVLASVLISQVLRRLRQGLAQSIQH